MIFNVGAGGASNAESIKYDNSLSGLEADNVQGAVDELNDSLKSYYDEETETLYIQGGTSNYTYDSDTETLYIG